MDTASDAGPRPARAAVAGACALNLTTAIAAVVLLFSAVQLVRGAFDVGVTLDEPIHAERLQGWLDDGWYVQPWLLVDGTPAAQYEESNPYVYGPAYALLGHAANMIAGNESSGEVSTTADAYAVRHLVSALLALLGAAAAGLAAWRLSGSWRVGLWAAAALLAIPRWSGHGFFNPKDVPTASGYAMVTAALVLALWERPAETRWPRRVGIAACLGFGVFVAAGTRPGIWPALFASVLAYAILRLGQWRLGGLRRPAGTDLAVAAGAAAGLLAIAAAYPKAAGTPFKFLAETVSQSSSYPWEGVTLTAGRSLSEHPPIWYLPAWIGATVPLLIGALALGGFALALAALWRLSRRTRAGWDRRELGLALVLAQLLLVPAAAITGGSTLYDGLRQHLYVLPAIAVLAAFAGAAAWAWTRRRPPGWRWALAAALGLALVVPTVQQAILFPYDYTYFNPAARLGGVDGRWEADYWFASVDDAVARVPRGVEMMCGGLVVPGEADAKPEVSPCAGSQFEAFADRRGTQVAADADRGDGGRRLWAVALRRNGAVPAPGCEDVGDVTRPLLGETVVMSYVLRCERDAVTVK